jgi:sugar transferase (PEP-CTERM/EpsH1 system associated)
VTTPRDTALTDEPRLTTTRPLSVVVVSPDIPFPPNWGFAKRVFHLVEGLARRHAVTLVTYVQDGEEQAARELSRCVTRLATVRKPASTPTRRRLDQATSVLSPTPFHARGLRSAALQQALDAVLAEERVDVVLLESSQLGWLRVPAPIPVVVDEHNLESELLGRMHGVEASLPRRLFNRWEAFRYRRYERSVWARAAACAATSERDAAAVRAATPAVPVAVVPNGVDTATFRPPRQRSRSDSLVFLGLLNYRPNVDGLRFFLDEVLPLIHRTRPSVQLTVVGGGGAELSAELARPGVTFTGWVPDVRPYLWSADIAVVPLRFGGGTRLKVLDALATCTPIVSTTIGVEGIDVVPGKHFLPGDDPESFADAVLELLDDDDRRAQLSRAGRALVEQQYSWDRSVAALERLMTSLVPVQQGPATDSVRESVIDVPDAPDFARVRAQTPTLEQRPPTPGLVSVVVPCYNYAHYLRDCVGSALHRQQDVPVEVVIVDDCSTDSTEQVGRQLAAEDSQVRYYRNERNLGHIATYNRGFDLASGEFLTLVSADDMVTPGALARAATALSQDPEISFVYGPVAHTWDLAPGIDPGAWAAEHDTARAIVMPGDAWAARVSRTARNPIASPEVVVRASAQRAVGGYRPDLPHSGDLETWLRLSTVGSVAELVGPCQALRRMHTTNMSGDYSRTDDLTETEAAFRVFNAYAALAWPDPRPVQPRVRRVLARRALRLALDLIADPSQGSRGEVEALVKFARDRSGSPAVALAGRLLLAAAVDDGLAHAAALLPAWGVGQGRGVRSAVLDLRRTLLAANMAPVRTVAAADGARRLGRILRGDKS